MNRQVVEELIEKVSEATGVMDLPRVETVDHLLRDVNTMVSAHLPELTITDLPPVLSDTDTRRGGNMVAQVVLQ